MTIHLVKRKNKLVLTFWSWLIILILILVLFCLFLKNIHPFLAENKPLRGEILVIEGWLPDYAFEKGKEEFEANNYKMIVSIGGPLSKGFFLAEYKTGGRLGAATLIELGLDKEVVRAVNVPNVKRNRTLACAVALKNAIRNSGMEISSVDLVTIGTHAKRSKIIYERVFGEELKIGIISIKNKNYDADEWWKSSDGFRTVTGEIIAYIYVMVFYAL